MAETTLIVRKKITARFEDGTTKQNLGIPSAVELVKDQPVIPVTVDKTDEQAMSIVRQLAATLGKGLQERETDFVLSDEETAQDDPTDAAEELFTETSEDALGEAGIHFTETDDFGLTDGIEGSEDTGDTVVTEEPATQTFTKPEVVADFTDTSDLGGDEVITAAQEDLEALFPKNSALVKNGLIILGPQEVFADCEKAYAHLMENVRNEPLPGRYHSDLTLTFFKGSPEGQVQSIFKDLKKFGPQEKVLGKIANIIEHSKTSAEPAYRRYVYFVENKMLPHHTITFQGGRPNMNYFKYWALCMVLKRVAGK